MADTAELMSHVQDANAFHLPFGGEIHLPCLGTWDVPAQNFLGLFQTPAFTLRLQVTKFMVIELIAALLMLAIFIPLARRIARGGPPKGKFWNFFEAMLVFMRDQVARPAIGKHDADRFLPYIWTAFFFVLFCNLLGLVPWLGSPTGALGCTGALAMIAFAVCVGAGVKQFGPVGYVLGQVPHMDLPWVLAIFLKPMILAIELLSLIIKHSVLAIRLLANMFAGHLVLAVILGFIAQTATLAIWYGVMPASVLGAVALNLLELLVAFLQAYIFAFLSALFIGMAVHQH
jgi:F-type H+-transporting ATPase subunit a